MDTRKGAKDRWEEAYSKTPERDAEFSTMSGVPIKPLYTPEDVEGDYDEKLGYPGEYPYTRGVYPNMYRGRLWTVRQFAGFGTPAETNRRFRYLLDHGQNGLSVAFDMPTLMGLDSDSPLSLGEVGTEGVAVDSLEDMERLFEGIPMGRGLDLHDHQRPGDGAARDVRRRRREAGRRAQRSSPAPTRTTSSRSTSPRRSGSSRPRPPCASSRTCSSTRPSTCRSGTRSPSAATTSARPGVPQRRNWLSPWPTASRTWRPASRRASTLTTSPRASLSSSTRT